MQKTFVPLDLSLIDQGLFVANAADEFAELQHDLVAYQQKHGEDAAGAKAKFVLEIVLGIEPPVSDDAMSIVAQIKKTMPSRPATTSKAIAGQTDTGEGALFVQVSGSSKAPPGQAALCTQDGRTIDPEDGTADKPKTAKDKKK